MTQAIEIINELEKVFDEKTAKTVANAILKNEESSHANLATKNDIHLLKAELQKEMADLKTELRKEMSDGFLEMQKSITDVQKSITDVQKSITDIQKSITRMTIFFISAIGALAVILKILDIIFKT